MVTVEGRGPLDGTDTLVGAGLGVVGSEPAWVHPPLQTQNAGLAQQAVNPQRNASVVHVGED